MAAANLSSSSSSPHTLHRCLTNPQPLHPSAFLKPPFKFNSHDHKLASVRCQIPKFEPTTSHSTHPTSSSSSTIDFLTLCHSLKFWLLHWRYRESNVVSGILVMPFHYFVKEVRKCYFPTPHIICNKPLLPIFFGNRENLYQLMGSNGIRKGWVNQGIKGSESIADHMYRMALMALVADDLPGINRERCIKIALVHDIAEAIVGDITPSDGVPKVEKSRLEQAALNEMCEVLGGGKRAEEIKELWREYEDNASLEANLVKDFDKIEMILQALEYETEHDRILDEFFLSTAGKLACYFHRKPSFTKKIKKN
ncbi:putative HD/PDEase domain, 5'-deoxynucleotidase YfbR/HDDC2 [Helianthus annuus]|nr:putative HD/PDEase domain, 5'-deoxynucleotidase YfbR/HDDC2 [Helianthus annuus]